ncbi:major facilitator superfamily-domain-containing protein [Limtongia smithiae]|uniref:major facilitator superfamily-domain-containing protein n=1 Tax=Limtongia smithiae TaxID=1125753 RepID=UPI0034CF941D
MATTSAVEDDPLAATRTRTATTLPPDVVAHEAIILDSDDVEDITEPLLPAHTRATLPNPFTSSVSGRSSRASSFTASESSSTRRILRRAGVPGMGGGSGRGQEEELTNARLAVVFASLYIGVFLGALDGTIVATLLAHIASEFDGFRNVSWIATAYLIANAAFQPLYGKLTDIFGRKPGLLFSNITFGIGCLGCGLAPSLWLLVLARVIAGIGGGGLMALSTITLSDLVPLRKRGVLQGFGNILYGSGAALGGVFGGYVTSVLGWRAAFLLQVPFIVASTLAIKYLLVLPDRREVVDDGDDYSFDGESAVGSDDEYDGAITVMGDRELAEAERRRERRLLARVDFFGAGMLVIALVLFLLAVSIGGNQVPWTHPLVLVTLPLSVAGLGAWFYIELRVAKEPIIPVQLLSDRTIFGAAMCNWFMTMSVYSLLFYVPLYFVAVRGVSETRAGASLVSNFIGVAMGSFGAGLYMRSTGRYYALAVISAVVYVLGTALVCTLGMTTNTLLAATYTYLPGVAYGALLTITLIALIAAVPHEFQAVATSIQYGFRGTGSTLGVAAASAIFQNVLARALRARIFGADAESVIARVLDNVEEVNRLPEFLVPVVREAYLVASRAVFVFCFGLAIAVAGMTVLMREHVLHSTISRR